MQLTHEQLDQREALEHDLLNVRQLWYRHLREEQQPSTTPERRAELEAERRQLLERAQRLSLEIAAMPTLSWTRGGHVFEI